MKTLLKLIDLVLKFGICLALWSIANRTYAQSWQDSNRGLYPQSIQATVNPKNTAIGFRYGYLFKEQPFGLYASFSNTISPNTDYNNYDWERKYSLGGMVQLPYNIKMRGIHTFFTVGAVYNQHPEIAQDKYATSVIGCDVGVEFQIHHYRCHLTVDVVNFMRYIQIGCGYTFFR
jgi:hypothetical protein